MDLESSLPLPGIIGLKKSFGFGDRLGLATPGHLAAARKFDFAPIFAQQSIREMQRTERTAEEVLLSAQVAVKQAGFNGLWGADADHLKTEVDVYTTSAAGFSFFTIDPSAFVGEVSHRPDLSEAVSQLIAEGIFPSRTYLERHLDSFWDVEGTPALRFDQAGLWRAAVKYGRVIDHCQTMAKYVQAARTDRPFEIELSVDETDDPTTPLEHLFIALELKERKVPLISLALRFPGDFEKGIDYKGDLAEFSRTLEVHARIARQFGPYKLSVHSGSDKFSIYPIVGKICGELLHVKTAGTSYLEALRVVCLKQPALFAEIAAGAAQCFSTDKKSYHISTTEEEIQRLKHISPVDYERRFLNEREGRQLLHVTFGSVLTRGRTKQGRPFGEAIRELLARESDLYQELLDVHFTRHLALLSRG